MNSSLDKMLTNKFRFILLIRSVLFIAVFLFSLESKSQSPFHAQCEKATEDPIQLYYSLTSIEGRERLIAIEEQNQLLIKLRQEIVVDSISQLVWSFIWRPYIESLTLAINTTNLSYAEVKQKLMSVCFGVADRYAALVRDLNRSRALIIPFSSISSVINSSNKLPKLISPFGNGWVDSNGTIYQKQGNAIIDTNGNKIERIGNYFRSNTGQILAPFGNGYIDATSTYNIKKFGYGYIDSNGNSVQPFGKGWILR